MLTLTGYNVQLLQRSGDTHVDVSGLILEHRLPAIMGSSGVLQSKRVHYTTFHIPNWYRGVVSLQCTWSI